MSTALETVKADLAKKRGPLPTWGYLVIGTGLLIWWAQKTKPRVL
jgi:hypothetical protein